MQDPLPAPDFIRRLTGGVFYGWRLVVIGALVVAAAGRNSSLSLFGQYFFALHRPFSGAQLAEWSDYLYHALAAVGALLPPVVGVMVDRSGSRKPMLIGLPMVGIGLLLAGLAPRVAPVVVSMPLVLFGSPLAAFVPAATAVNHWFRRSRPMAIALVMLGAAAAGAVADQVDGSADPTPVIATGVVVLAVALPLALLVRNRPEPHGEHPDGIEPKDDEPVPEYTVREAIRSREFWMLVVAVACLSAASSIIKLGVIFPADGDIAPVLSDELSTLHTVIHMVFILVGAYVGAREPLRKGLIWFAVAHLSALATLLAANGILFFVLAAALLGVGTGGVQVLSIVALGAYFGRYRFATVLGIYLVVSAMLSGAANSGAFLLNNLTHLGPPTMVASGVFVAIGVGAYLVMRDPQTSPSQTLEGAAEQPGDQTAPLP